MRQKENFAGRFLGKFICFSKEMCAEVVPRCMELQHHLGPGVKLVPTLFLGEPAVRRDEKSGCCIVVLSAKLANSVMALPLDIYWGVNTSLLC